MTSHSIYYFIEGVALAFYVILSVQNILQRDNRLRHILGWILAYWGLELLVSIVLSGDFLSSSRYLSHVVDAFDLTATPTCLFLLMELCRPGWVTARRIVINEIPFLALGAASIFIATDLMFYILVGYFVVYGTGIAIVVINSIPCYNHFLKGHYSYQENVNLRWVYAALATFYLMMVCYAVCAIQNTILADSIYLGVSIVGWAMICCFVARQESVVGELEASKGECPEPLQDIAPDLGNVLRERFVVPQLYLNPHLKLGDLALAVGTNRTYLSRYLNDKLHSTFYDYVNALRLDHAELLLSSSDYSIQAIAAISGFNSYSTFRRSFIARHHISPQEYRASHPSSKNKTII